MKYNDNGVVHCIPIPKNIEVRIYPIGNHYAEIVQNYYVPLNLDISFSKEYQLSIQLLYIELRVPEV